MTLLEESVKGEGRKYNYSEQKKQQSWPGCIFFYSGPVPMIVNYLLSFILEAFIPAASPPSFSMGERASPE
jgi:hypothetical protein